MFILVFIGAMAAVQYSNAFLLLLLGYPSIVSKYLEGFHTKNPQKWYEYLFNIVFWLFISIALFSYRKVDKKYGFFKTKLYYGLGIVVSYFLLIGFVIPFLVDIIPEYIPILDDLLPNNW
ncbi:Uncharacterised protein [Niallia circulans]|uniref:hypothetical protein n=1 Tax=Shouchella clausii TaxID=79880 RepID=UPI000D997411|nr:hypothetical protein [Shouchella clausii]MCM3548439.1 hypothetical protein [Shouchella clausii]SPT78289.1 Uncharacterised protein [Niallia circulans]